MKVTSAATEGGFDATCAPSVTTTHLRGKCEEFHRLHRGRAQLDVLSFIHAVSEPQTLLTGTGNVVLVIDDDEDNRDTLADFLREQGFEVITANNGLDALAMLRGTKTRPRLILLDLKMPVLNGFQFLEDHRLDPSLSLIPVVVTTGDDAAGREDIRALQVPVLSKPIQLKLLMDTIRQLCKD